MAFTFQFRNSSIRGHKAPQYGGDEFSRIDHLTTLTRKRFCIRNEITMHGRRQLRTHFDRLVVWKLSYFEFWHVVTLRRKYEVMIDKNTNQEARSHGQSRLDAETAANDLLPGLV
ncbi:hypothetical protein XI08_08045 [Bradyrhizobium sp. CCBAU 11361]|nr:hypothetical protein [Bradyrhizobium sp. CCBAU 11361]